VSDKIKNSCHQDFAQTLSDRYGPLMSGDSLCRALGYENGQAFRQARRQKRLGIHVFNVPSRRGLFALTADVAKWLSTVSQPDFDDLIDQHSTVQESTNGS
jgi:hypothetical protein